jgi:hypothetical protein
LNPNIIILLIRVDVVEWSSFAKNGPLSPKKLVWQEKEGHFLLESGPLLIFTYQLKRKVKSLFEKNELTSETAGLRS